ncbi:MAG: hypothetical protein AB1696_20310 [Planctomycetota bacterium]
MQAKYKRGVYMPNWGEAPLHILTYMKDESWVCHCLEFNLCGKSSASQEAAFLDMKHTIEEFFEQTRDFALADKGASAELWEAWNAAENGTPPRPDQPLPDIGSN